MNLAERIKDHCGFGLLRQRNNPPSHQILRNTIATVGRRAALAMRPQLLG